MKRLLTTLLLALALAAVAVAAGCGEEEEELDVIEGEPVELGELSYNVQITRFLNPDDNEDRGYLVGQAPPPAGEGYFAVFLTIENDGDVDEEIPYAFRIVDTQGNEFSPIPSGSTHALQLPGQDEAEVAGIEPGTVDDLQDPIVPAGGEIPALDTTAADGVIGGSMLLFQLPLEITENRPLEFEIPGPTGEVGRIELDI